MAQITAPNHAWRLLTGVLLTLLGAAILATLIYVFNCGGEACERAMVTLGLGLSALVAAVGQFAVLVGLRLIWLALRGDS